MPGNKKPRKNKQCRQARFSKAIRKLVRNEFKNKDDVAKTLKYIDNVHQQRFLAESKITWMTSLLDRDKILSAFVRSQLALKSLPTTKNVDDFNLISSSLMLGALCHQVMGVEENELMTEIRRSAFAISTAYRLWLEGKPVPEANLPGIGYGLDAAQDLIEYAFDNDPSALKEVLIKNDPHYCQLHPEETEARERFILGDRYDEVAAWKLGMNLQ